ncbi:DNA-formamidopyrimidine glycosylase [Bacillus sp. FJAT-42376]|uniref:DNA-formamidopyrimidine glycosylase n=1 Tax=Bacillus sp. FJAT-42376 TaxID=2014076 RepID=UPI000F4F024A|nr:DNA-formamidopyrimidine glycosylase [Bacillus sp. FJAT-42376]AZB43895.1 DNA-formamidopyrimidine glycosylase [Bacillus sp. FJAT-42376]
MPELPEVETVRRTLIELVKGKTIAEIDVRWPKMIKKPDDVFQFQDALKGQVIRDIGRRGKFLMFSLDDYVLVSHLRMEGKYGLYRDEEEPGKHTHVIFRFGDGTHLRYDDVRKFGTMHLFEKGKEQHDLPLSQLGPEPFSNEFSADYLADILSRTNRMIKVVLLDQRVVTGLGNIYVDEALFRARLHPEKPAKELSINEVHDLKESIISTLGEAVEQGGSTIRSYVNSQGKTGMFQLQLFVYGRKAEPCKVCGTAIEKKTVGGRGTHYCPNCQLLDPGISANT